MPRSRVLCCLIACFAACSPTFDRPKAVFQPSSEGFFDTPWPSDARMTEDGSQDWSNFPNPSDIALLESFVVAADGQQGAPHNAPIYVRFDEPIDLDALPEPVDSSSPAALVQLINVDPRSDEFGERIPFRWEFREQDGAYVDENLLAISPLPGWSLRPRTTYALVVHSYIAEAPGSFRNAWNGDGVWGTSMAPLRRALPVLGWDADEIGVATVFTTGDPLAEMENVARFVSERITPPTFEPQLEHIYDRGVYRVFRSNYTTPIFMTGDKPYADEGGAFEFRADGLPVVQSWDPMRMSVVTSQSPLEEPEDGWPVLVYLHGTGGYYRTYCNSSRDLEVATWLAPMGIVGIGIDLPLHGPRGNDDTIIDLHSFNVLQPDAALHIHRQAAADLLYLLQGLAEGPTFTTHEGQEIRIDPNRIVVMGHSQGGLTTAIGLPWMGDLVEGAVLSGAGGLLAITAVERDADYDFPTMIKTLLEFSEGEELTELHPILGMVQSIVEPTDPVNFAPYWFHRDGGYTGSKPTPVLMTSGIRDDATPSRTSEALATAARAPFAGTRYSAAVPMLLRDLDTQDMPLQYNALAWDGAPITTGLSQWQSGDHFVVFQDADARDIVRTFIRTAIDGEAVIAPTIEPEAE